MTAGVREKPSIAPGRRPIDWLLCAWQFPGTKL
jgi:hypothetical protein